MSKILDWLGAAFDWFIGFILILGGITWGVDHWGEDDVLVGLLFFGLAILLARSE